MLRGHRFSHTVILSLLVLLINMFSLSAQSIKPLPQQKAEKKLILYLNKLIADYPQNKLGKKLGKMQKPFAINNQGILKVVRLMPDYENNGKSCLIKHSIPISKISSVFYDYYVGFVGNDDVAVKEEKAANIKAAYKTVGYLSLLHIAPLGDGEFGVEIQKKLMMLVKGVQAFYPK